MLGDTNSVIFIRIHETEIIVVFALFFQNEIVIGTNIRGAKDSSLKVLQLTENSEIPVH